MDGADFQLNFFITAREFIYAGTIGVGRLPGQILTRAKRLHP